MKTAIISAFFLAVPATWAATLSHDYNLTSAALNSDGGSVTASGYSFGADQGLNVSSFLSNTGDYSILIDFSFTDLSGYRKILDFQNLASDNGLYNLSTDLNYYNFAFGPNGAFTADTLARVIVTRDASTGLFVGYVNGVQQIIGVVFARAKFTTNAPASPEPSISRRP